MYVLLTIRVSAWYTVTVGIAEQRRFRPSCPPAQYHIMIYTSWKDWLTSLCKNSVNGIYLDIYCSQSPTRTCSHGRANVMMTVCTLQISMSRVFSNFADFRMVRRCYKTFYLTCPLFQLTLHQIHSFCVTMLINQFQPSIINVRIL